MTPIRIVLFLIVMTSMSLTAFAQSPPIMYESTLPGDFTIPHARDIVVDQTGNAYLIGSAYEDNVSLDVIVAKLDPAGNEIWTYTYANTGHSYATGIALDSTGRPWVTGWTDDPEFPLVDPIDTVFETREMFVMALDAADGGLHFSTFLGGDYTDTGEAIVINDQDEIIIGGTSGSTDFPTTADAWQPEPSFPLYFFQDGVVVKLAPGGSHILYATYFGGREDDWIDSIALDGQGNIIVAGRTHAEDFPLVDPIDATPDDLFLGKLSADGQELLFGTYFGGSDVDRVSRIRSDAAGNVCMAGITRSEDLPTTPGAFSPGFVGAVNGCEVPFGGDFNCEDFFVFRLSTTGSGILWGTYLGGTTVDEARDIACDALGNVFVTGYTRSSDFPDSDGSFDAAILVCKLSPDGSTLDFTHTVASGSANRGNGICVDAQGDIYFTGTVGVPAGIYVSKLQGDRTTAVDDGRVVSATGLAMAPNSPNPFNPRTEIRFSLPDGATGAAARLVIHDAAGRIVRRLLDDHLAAGEHHVDWSGRDDAGRQVGAGVYYARLSWAGEARTRPLVLLK